MLFSIKLTVWPLIRFLDEWVPDCLWEHICFFPLILCRNGSHIMLVTVNVHCAPAAINTNRELLFSTVHLELLQSAHSVLSVILFTVEHFKIPAILPLSFLSFFVSAPVSPSSLSSHLFRGHNRFSGHVDRQHTYTRGPNSIRCLQ